MRRVLSGAIVALALLAGAPTAWAHATFPGQTQVTGNADQRLSLDVPEERGDTVHNVGVKVFLPVDWRPVSCQATAPWHCGPNADADSGRTVVGWTKDAGTPPGSDDETFIFTIHTGAPGTVTIPVHQIYDSGETVRWIGAPDSDEPAPTLQVVAGQPATTTSTAAPTTTTATAKPGVTTTTRAATTTASAAPGTTTTVVASSSTVPPTTIEPTAAPSSTTAAGEAQKPASTSSSGSGGLVAAGLILVLLAVGAGLVLRRRRRGSTAA